MCVPATSLLQYPVVEHPGNLAKLRLCLGGVGGAQGRKGIKERESAICKGKSLEMNSGES